MGKDADFKSRGNTLDFSGARVNNYQYSLLIYKTHKMKYIQTLKYAAFIILAVANLQACNSPENKDDKSDPEQVVKTDTSQGHEHQAVSELSLNNGVKWKADSSTNKNVLALRRVIEAAKPVTNEEYRNAGENLEQGIKKMISECRMQGPDHDALHHWLEPLMEENKKLLEVTTAEKGKDMLGLIRKQIENYSTYFE